MKVEHDDRAPSMLRILREADDPPVPVGWLVHEAVVRGRCDDHEEARDAYEVLKKRGELYEPTAGKARVT
jgi:hypothetical protein